MTIGMIFHSIFVFLRKILLFLTNINSLFISRIFVVKIQFLYSNFNCKNIFFMIDLEYQRMVFFGILWYSLVFSFYFYKSYVIFFI